jgi:hypothetical protein
MITVPRAPSPQPRVRAKERDTEIDIYTSRNSTEVDIHKSASHHRLRERSRSRDRPSPGRAFNDEVIVRSDRNRLEVDVGKHGTSRRRAHSAAPPVLDYDDEAAYITSRIDARGRMGEAHNGITKDWTIIDVPPGTERVRMDGVGGAGADVTWQRYNGVRRSKFVPERGSDTVVSTSSTSLSDRDDRHRDRDTRLSVQIIDKDNMREREIDVEKVTDRRLSIRREAPSPAPRRNEMWTEITKDLITHEAIEELGYEYEETEFFFYVMEYLRYVSYTPVVTFSSLGTTLIFFSFFFFFFFFGLSFSL